MVILNCSSFCKIRNVQGVCMLFLIVTHTVTYFALRTAVIPSPRIIRISSLSVNLGIKFVILCQCKSKNYRKFTSTLARTLQSACLYCIFNYSLWLSSYYRFCLPESCCTPSWSSYGTKRCKPWTPETGRVLCWSSFRSLSPRPALCLSLRPSISRWARSRMQLKWGLHSARIIKHLLEC